MSLNINAFYASCETVFRPDLWGKPVVVLMTEAQRHQILLEMLAQ
ncbi:hypothetical protein O5626_29190, partial [Escherichia coli]|nr:hypothetical protein [Escherichia coli]